ncbi:MAG: PAS domain-containing protein [Armatimonadetes bacterium]|nr:PAS domain-containing protein [Armatimonadota bacterium]
MHSHKPSPTPAQPAPLADGCAPTPPLMEFEETLKRLVDRIAKILQAERCVFLLHDPVAGTLYATHPALGFTREQLLHLERRISEDGLSVDVFRNNTPIILYDAAHDPRAATEGLAQYGVRNGVSVPLIVERRDDENRILERTTVGVLHVFNKKDGGIFLTEDVGLLERMATTAAAVIASAQMYREVIQEKQELIHTIESLYAGLLVVGNNGRIVQINPSARAILDLAPHTPLVGVPFERVVAAERVRALLDRALDGGPGELAEEITVPIKDAQPEDPLRERIYQVQCAPVRDDDGAPAGIVAVFNDITEIRGVERMKTDFIRTVSHELRTPLTSIKGFISTLLADTEGFYDEATRREFYAIVDTECDRLTRLIQDLLDIARIEQGRAMQMHWEDVDAPALAEKVLSVQRAYAKNHALALDFPPDFPHIEADPDKLEQILTNLVSNAIKYSPRGGEVRVVGRVVTDRAGGEAHPRAVSLRVTDEGMGISREHLPKLFDRFYRVDNRDSREIGGTGIGLALVKALTEAHHGTVTVESETGRGSVFTLILPVRQTEGAGPRKGA